VRLPIALTWLESAPFLKKPKKFLGVGQYLAGVFCETYGCYENSHPTYDRQKPHRMVCFRPVIMWLATQHGFYSIVQKPAGQFHVRTRCKQDLENLIALAALDAPIHHTKVGDYAWRIVVGQPGVSKIMAALATSIDYPNFKDRIHDEPAQRDKLPAYSQLWSQMLAYQSAQESR